ncbi:hypothetical protein [Neobacillus sp. LXY-4]|uniref:hypothetical protein n=1 Tax=Neobacillus sp. LXY-4 TaxID=3379826 RepID=UPI003EE1AD58
MATIGTGYLIEAVIYIFLHCYQYYPHIIKHDPVYDSNLGAIASNALALPVAATFLAVLRKNWVWSVAFIGFFSGVEWLFLKVQIYTHNWWRIEYTALGLLIFYFPFAKWLNRMIMKPQKGVLHTLLLLLVIGPLLASFHIFPIMFFSARYYDFGFFDNISQDTNAFSTIYYLGSCLLLTILAKLDWKNGWMKYIIISISIFAVTIFLRMIGILHSLVWWDTYYYILYPNLLLIITVYISKRLYLGPQSR